MTIRRMLRFWLAWLAPVSRPLPVVLALPAPALPSYRWLSLEALYRLPAVEADLSRHVFPHGTADLFEGGRWLAEVWPGTWGHESVGYRELQAGVWLGLRGDALLEARHA